MDLQIFVFFIFILFLKVGSQCNYDWPRTCYVNQVGLELEETLLSLAALQCWDHRHVPMV